MTFVARCNFFLISAYHAMLENFVSSNLVATFDLFFSTETTLEPSILLPNARHEKVSASRATTENVIQFEVQQKDDSGNCAQCITHTTITMSTLLM
jgi:hypothetical protein